MSILPTRSLLGSSAAPKSHTPEELAARAVQEYLARNDPEPVGDVEGDPLAWLGRYPDDEAQSARIDDSSPKVRP